MAVGRRPPLAGRSTSRTSTATAASCRCASPDPDGAWMPHADDARLMVPVPLDGAPRRHAALPACSTRARSVDHDGFTIPTPRPPEGLDLNRNFPAGWGTGVRGSGDHPLSEPEIDALVRAIVARPNVCGYNAFHTSGGVLLRPSSTAADSALPPVDVWVVEAARRDRHRAHRLPGALGLRGLHVGQVRHDERRRRRLGLRAPRRVLVDDRVLGRRPRRHRARSRRPTSGTSARPTSRRWPCCAGSTSTRPSEYVDVVPVRAPPARARSSSAAGTTSGIWTNPPPSTAARRGRRRTPRSPSPRRWPRRASRSSTRRPSTSAAATWRVEAGIANTGWLPTHVSARGAKEQPDPADRRRGHRRRRRGRRRTGPAAARPARRAAPRCASGTGTTARPTGVLATWVVRAAAGHRGRGHRPPRTRRPGRTEVALGLGPVRATMADT